MRPAILLSCLVAAIHGAASCSPPEFTFAPDMEESRCNDDRLNGSETDTDCGGLVCGNCALGRSCALDDDCVMGSCIANRCQAAHCVDQGLSDGESDVDCGGAECSKCGVNQRCSGAADCLSNACVGGRCIATGCDNLQIGGAETDVDCGGGTCPRCPLGKRCDQGTDCESGVCTDGACSSESLPCEDDPIGCQPNVNTGGMTGQGGVATTGGSPSSGGSDAGQGGALSGAGGTAGNASGGSGGGNESGGQVTAGGQAPTGGASTGGQAPAPATGGMPSATGGTGGGLPPDSCPGCARLSVPLAAATHFSNFVIVLPSLADFRGKAITFRVFKHAGSGGRLRPYVQHGGSPDYYQLFRTEPEPLTASGAWEDIVWNIGDDAGSFDLGVVASVGLQVSGAGSSQWTNPTEIYVDSITVSGASVGPWNFDSGESVVSTVTTDAPPNLIWCNGNDSPVTGSTVAWVGP
jgi:hypothetical protein